MVSTPLHDRNNKLNTTVEGRANMGNSGIFGYVNYLVEKDRKTILDTLVNGMPSRDPCALERAATIAIS